MARDFRFISCIRTAFVAAGVAAALPVQAQESAAPVTLQAALAVQANGDLKGFYFHGERPLWVGEDGSFRPAADELTRLIRSAAYDGLDPQRLGLAEIEAAVQQARASGAQADLVKAELALTEGLVRYVESMMRPSVSAMVYEHEVLKPFEPDASTVLVMVAQSPTLEEFVTGMRWMHPLYAQVRQGLAAGEPEPALRQAAVGSLQRIRDLPAPPWSRHVVIDIPSATLWMYEAGRVVDSMKIVVGKADTPTPQMAGYIRYATLNPYWNVPEHLVRDTIAANVLRQGMGYLRTRGYEVLSDWSDSPSVVDPATIDWRAVANGSQTVRVRQKPGGTNAMGKVKYEFPNALGIYLHDTPEKQYMLRAVRQLSNGCIRLEDAQRFGRWLLGGELPAAGPDPEQRVDLAEPVPIYVTYLTVRPEGSALALGTDPYGLDAPALALSR